MKARKQNTIRTSVDQKNIFTKMKFKQMKNKEHVHNPEIYILGHK